MPDISNITPNQKSVAADILGPNTLVMSGW
jgi:hypothetical protein